jgi:sugar transferase (PEP-CTERM/EpsH1 system associated)
MRILWIKMGGLWPLDTGGRLRSFHLLSELSRRHPMTLLTTHGDAEDPAELAKRLPPGTRVVSLPYRIPKRGSVRFARALVRSWFSSMPVDAAKFRVPEVASEARRIIEAGEADLCVADFLSALPNVPLESGVPVVFFAHNVEHMIWKRLSGLERGLSRMFLELEWRKMRRFEARVCARSTMVLTVSDADRELLASLAPRARMAAIPTGVDVDYFTPQSDGASEESTEHMVFTGSMDWHPNEDGILYFIDRILPRIRRELPRATLTVAGRNPSPRVRARSIEAGIRVTGGVPDIRPYVGEASVYVVPLRIGGGTRLKIFEALAMGKAVVSTRVGAEGLPIVPGEHLVLADEPDEFARAVVALLKDPSRRRALGASGRRLVETRYSWAQVARQFESQCRQAVTGSGYRSSASWAAAASRES